MPKRTIGSCSTHPPRRRPRRGVARCRRPTILVGLVSCAVPASCSDDQAGQGPALVVLISADQMRGDFLDETAARNYTQAFERGFRRLLDDGLVFPKATHDHAVTHTAPGHATLATGVFPARSGIVANTWREKASEEGEQWIEVYAVADESSPLVGVESGDSEGRSPRNLNRSGLGDWLIAHDSDARAVAISSKDRSAITLAGHAGQAYWLHPAAGRVVTSTYYARDLPNWVQAFNAEEMPELTADSVWESIVPPHLETLARPDEAPYEGDGVHSTFPHRSSAEADGPGERERREWLLRTPKSDEIVLAFAMRAIEELELGRRGSVDYLAVGFSATDYVGHGYGPFSQEQLSNLIHLDGVLGALFDHLDEVLGSDGWIAAVSSDHGVATMPEASEEWGPVEGRRLDSGELAEAMFSLLEEARSGGGGESEVAVRLAAELEASGLAAKAYAHAELRAAPPADSLAGFFRNSWHPERLPHFLSTRGVEYAGWPGDLAYWGPQGTTHGSPHLYDRWVPLVFLGAGVRSGISWQPVRTVDVAPTLAALARVPTPTDLDGDPLTESVEIGR